MRSYLHKIISSVCVIFIVSVSYFAPISLIQAQTFNLAVTPVGFDNMGLVLQRLGYKAVDISDEDLTDYSKIKNYDAIYINCSSAVDDISENAVGSIRQYVENGGVIYASDFANSVISAAFPDKINFYKSTGYDNESLSSAMNARVGNSGVVNADIVDSGLAAMLGKSKVSIDFNLDAWVVIDSVSKGVRVHMRGPANVYDFGDYKQPANVNWENIDWNDPKAIKQFEAPAGETKTIEDTPYVVSFSQGDGEVLYTVFHNEAQNTDDMESMLDWFAVKTRAGKLAKQTRQLAGKGKNDVVLQEIVDALNQDESKSYTFDATGKSDFKVVIDGEGIKPSVTIEDPNGESIVKENVDLPLIQNISAVAGTYKINVVGTKVSDDNSPLVIVVAGPEKAATNKTVYSEKEDKGFSFDTKQLILIGITGVVIVSGLFYLRMRGKR